MNALLAVLLVAIVAHAAIQSVALRRLRERLDEVDRQIALLQRATTPDRLWRDLQGLMRRDPRVGARRINHERVVPGGARRPPGT